MTHVPQRVSVHLTRAATRQVKHGEMHIFADAVRRVRGAAAPGDVAVLYDPKDRPFALGLYDPNAPIRVRVLSPTLGVQIDAAWLRTRVHDALHKRDAHFNPTHTSGFRLIHGPGDGLPGLVVDRYAQTAVIKCYAHAWLPWLPTLCDALQEEGALQTGILRLSRNLQKQRPEPWHEGQRLWGDEASIATEFLEGGIRFEVDVRKGQKTGFFLDQRENRARVQTLCEGKNVLNVFCYTGGFSLYAAKGGARSVTSIDASRQAMRALQRNVALNPSLAQTTRFIDRCGDAFQEMQALVHAGETMDVTIVDPPSFAKKNSELEAAQKAYRRLAHAAAQCTVQGGTIVFASCSSRITEAMLEAALHAGVRRAGRRARITHRAGHPVDHPIARAQDQYLKCLYATLDAS